MGRSKGKGPRKGWRPREACRGRGGGEMYEGTFAATFTGGGRCMYALNTAEGEVDDLVARG